MNINVNIRLPICKQSAADFVSPILIDLLAPSEFAMATDLQDLQEDRWEREEQDLEYLVGRAWAERLHWFDAEQSGFDRADICDERSGTWAQVLETVSPDSGKQFRRELELEEFVSDIVFVHEILLHSDITDRVPIVDAMLRGISHSQTIMMMHHEQAESYHLEDWEYRDLGFKKIARSSLLLRDNHRRYPFGDAHVGGREVEFVATAEHEEWLLQRWEQLIADHPSL